MTTEEQILVLKKAEQEVNQILKERLSKDKFMTYGEFVDKFINPLLDDDHKICAGEHWSTNSDPEPLNFSDSPLIIDFQITEKDPT